MPTARPGPPGTGEQRTSPTPRVILWSRAGAEPPVDLVNALEGRGLAIEWATDAYGALSRLCVAHGRAGEAVKGPVALVLSEPERLGAATEVVAQARVRTPRAIVWVWEPASSMKLRPWREGDGVEPAPEPKPEPKPEVVVRPRAAAPALKLAGEGPEADPEPDEPVRANTPARVVEEGVAEEDDERTPRVSLTDEELAMLLEDDPREDHG